MLLILGNQIKAQCGKDCLYDSLQYANGICEKTIVVTFLAYGKDPINTVSDDEIRKIKKQIGYLPNSSVSFSYKEQKILYQY